MKVKDKSVKQINQHAMGTIMSHKGFGSKVEDCLAAVCEEIVRIEGLLSRFLPASEVYRVNMSAGVKIESVSLETYAVLEKAVEFSDCCPSTFDITIQPLVALWNHASVSCDQPDTDSIRQALAFVNYRDLILDPKERTAGLRNPGQSVDLGGIGKGFAGDRILEIYSSYGLTSAYSNLGGNVITLGATPGGSPWRIGIQHPRRENALLGMVSVIGMTVVTSGDYQRYFMDKQGIRRHHILNPSSGFPANSGLISVSVVSKCSLTADALSTILFVAGLENGRHFLRNFPDTEAILVDSDLKVYVTRGLEVDFQAEESIETTILD